MISLKGCRSLWSARSVPARLPYEHIRKLYNGFIVMASAYSKVAAQLKDYVNVYSDDSMDINSALMPVEKLKEVAKANQKAWAR